MASLATKASMPPMAGVECAGRGGEIRGRGLAGYNHAGRSIHGDGVTMLPLAAAHEGAVDQMVQSQPSTPCRSAASGPQHRRKAGVDGSTVITPLW